MKISILICVFLLASISYGQTNYYKLFDDIVNNDTLYNEKDFNLHFKTMINALPSDYSLTPIVFHRYEIKDTIINYVSFKKIWWGTLKIDPSNFQIVYKQDPLFLNLFKMLPEFKLLDLNGKTFSSLQLMGKPTLITFWSISCTGCILEFPQLDKLKEKYGDKVNFIAIGFDPPDEIKDFLKKKPFGFYHLADGYNYASNMLSISGIPKNIFLDTRGYIKEIKSVLPVEFDKKTGSPRATNNYDFDKILQKLTKL